MKEKLSNIIFVFLLGSISTILLLGIRAYTLPVIERYHETKFKATVLEAAGVKDASEAELGKLFGEKVTKMKKKGLTYYVTADRFYIFEFSGQGLWGPIKGLVTLNPDLITIERIRIIFQEETPGLGGRIGEEEYLAQFEKKKIEPKLNLMLRQKAEKENEIDAISGASLSSSALLDMINKAALHFRQVMEKEQ